MGIVEWLITVSVMMFVMCGGFPIVFSLVARGDKKLIGKEVIRTRAPILIHIFFLGFVALVISMGSCGIYFGTKDAMDANVIVLISLCVLGFSGLGIFAFLYITLNFVVSTNEGIEAHRLFHKTKFFRYEEIAYFRDTIASGMIGGLEGFDVDRKKIFAVEAMHIGVKFVADRLREKGVQQR